METRLEPKLNLKTNIPIFMPQSNENGVRWVGWDLTQVQKKKASWNAFWKCIQNHQADIVFVGFIIQTWRLLVFTKSHMKAEAYLEQNEVDKVYEESRTVEPEQMVTGLDDRYSPDHLSIPLLYPESHSRYDHLKLGSNHQYHLSEWVKLREDPS